MSNCFVVSDVIKMKKIPQMFQTGYLFLYKQLDHFEKWDIDFETQ